MTTSIALVTITAALSLSAAPRPLTLNDAVELALASAPNIAAHQVNEERARLQTLRANLERIHASVDATASALYVSPPFLPVNGVEVGYGAFLPLANLEASVGAPLFSGFRVESNIARAEHLEKAIDEDLAAERLAVSLAVARAYWSERRLALLENAQRAAAERLLESERLIQARINAGLAAGLDANRAAARRVQLDVDAATLSAQRREALARLAVLLGVDEEIVLVDVDAPVSSPVASDAKDANGVVQRALDTRPELRATDWRSLALQEEKRATESGFWPQLDAGVLAQLGNNPSLAGVGSRAIGGINGNVQAGLFLRMNLFDTFVTTHAVEDVEHRQRLASIERRALARNIESDVRVAHARVTSLDEQRAALVKARDLIGDNLATLQRVYANGDVLFTEVLDVQIDLANAERQIVGVDAELILAKLELAAATGDWTPGTTATAAATTTNSGKAGAQ